MVFGLIVSLYLGGVCGTSRKGKRDNASVRLGLPGREKEASMGFVESPQR
jgi:hypothetical protein